MRGLSRGWARPLFLDFFSLFSLFFFSLMASVSLSLFDELPKVRTRARRVVVFSSVLLELWLVLEVVVVARALVSAWELESEASDLRRARRTRSRIAMMVCVVVVYA